MNFFACLKCNKVEETSEFVPEVFHAHTDGTYKTLCFPTREEAERYASVTSRNWKKPPDGLAKFITGDGAQQTRVVGRPPLPYIDFAMMPALQASLEMEGNAPMDTLHIKRRRFEFRGYEEDGTLLYREVI